ncbi:uncharacterized protein PFL1_04120 [Pseudozyma flocculosa PF-1]|uniref:Related to YJU3 \|nr:uncharacterized protein PFL1_04120 [Pseudozyma flocculosa PF-1]EPQ28293.1 hypothetical protein PFL1_04120 [Pseudozyma flocculosa PF-1]SPO35438.1 related to YJU3 \
MAKPTTSPDPPRIEIPNAGSTEQYWIDSTHADKMRFWAKRWYPTAASSSSGDDEAAGQDEVQPKSCTVFCHGFVEYSERYREIFKVWPSKGHEIVAFDQRGWGETAAATANPAKAYGYATWPLQFEDLENVVRQTRQRLDERWGKDAVPIFNMGQSMGGGIVLAFQTRSDAWKMANRTSSPSAEARDLVRGTIAVAPWLRLTEPPHPLLAWVGNNIMSKIPGMPWYVDLKGANICRDPVVAANFENDRFCQKKVYIKTIAGPLFGGPAIITRDYEHWPKDKPLLALHGTGDLVTDHLGTKQLVDNIASTDDKEFKQLDGFYHDILMEPGQDKIDAAQYIVDWIEKRC